MSDLTYATDDELAGERDFLLRSLADLDAEREAGDVDEHDYQTLRDGYTARAAAVLRLIDQRGVDAERGLDPADGEAGVPVAVPGPTEAPSRRRRWRAVVVAALVAAFAVGAGLLVAGESGQRLPGETGSGVVPGSQTQGLLTQAVTSFQQGDVLDALKDYQKVLATDPANAEALAYRGWLLRLTGVQAKNTQLIDAGLASIQAAERADPSYPDAHFFGGEIYLRDKDDPKDAVTEFETYLADNPPESMGPEVQGELQAAQAALAGTGRIPPSAVFTPVPGATGASGATGVSGATGASGAAPTAAP